MKITDLTFEQMNNVAIADPAIGTEIFVFLGDTIYLDVKKLTGDSFTAIDDSGVIKFMFKLRQLAGNTQEVVNNLSVIAKGDALTSFPPFNYGISVDGLIKIVQVQTIQVSLLGMRKDPLNVLDIPNFGNNMLLGNNVALSN